jgi:hypothetical protein
MKKVIRFLFLAILLVMTSSVFNATFADPPDPPPLPGSHGNTDDVHVTAPIDGGLSIMLVMGLGYGALAVLRARKKESDEDVAVE